MNRVRAIIMGAVTSAYTSSARRDLMRGLHALGRRLSGRRPTIHYFHQADDPYSHLASQLLAGFAARYAVELKPWLVPPPDAAAAPERERLRAYALRDAARTARAYGLSFPATAVAPHPQALAGGQRILAEALAEGRFIEVAPRVGEALWRGDALGEVATLQGAEAALAAGEAERKRLGHYLGAMFQFEGEWYWGVDRLGHLEARLARLGLDTAPAGTAPLAPARDMTLAPAPESTTPLTIELWFSFRSPYSWLALPRVRQLAAHYGAKLKLRFILPMVMRGLPVPGVKRLYIVLDCKREAERVGLPFGRAVDPVGAGAERALAVLHHAIPLERGEVFAELGLRAAFAEGVDLAEDAGLYDVARRAGLTEDQAKAALADSTWRETAEINREALFAAGLWGAPTFRVNGGVAHWGQDRLWALEEDILAIIKASAAAE